MIARLAAKLGIRGRIFVAAVGTSLLVLVFALGITMFLAKRVIDADLTRLALSAGKSLEGILQAHHAGLVTQTRLLADLPVSRAVFSTHDAPTIQYFLEQHRAELGADVLMAADASGRVVATYPSGARARISLEPESWGRDTPAASYVVSSDKGWVYQMARAPVMVDGKLIGFLGAAFAVDDALARSLKRATGSEVTFFQGGRVCGSTWTGRERKRIALYLGEKGPQASQSAELKVIGREAHQGSYVGVTGEMRSKSAGVPWRYVLEFSAYPTMKLFGWAERMLVLLVLPICLIAAGVARGVSNKIARPIEAVISACHTIESGNWPAEVRPDPDAEIGLLARTFNKAVSSMKTASERDYLTGLYNRRYFNQHMDRELAQADETQSPLSVLMIDIDRFKDLNDRFGHPTGDKIMLGTAEVISRTVPQGVIACRYGGEEFAVILPGCAVEEAAQIAEKICLAVESTEFSVDTDEPVSVTVSIGIAEYRTACLETTELVDAADVALYYAKRLGRNCVATFDDVSRRLGIHKPRDLYNIMRESELISIETLTTLIDARPRHTDGHSDRVRRYALALGRSLGLTDEELIRIEVASLLHDVGKVRVPNRILDKPGRLSEEERAEMQLHSEIGESLIRKTAVSTEVLSAILHHHEHYDGHGYPGNLEGKAIPLTAQIIAIADVYDAITSERPYRHAMPPYKAVEIIKSGAGSQFDPELVDVFVSLVLKESSFLPPVDESADTLNVEVDTKRMAA